MGTQRSVEVAATDGGYRVTTHCRSLPEAMATVDKVLHSAPPEAFEPAGFSENLPTPTEEELAFRRNNFQFHEAPAPELPPHVEALATLDADDAAPRMMDKAEAVSR